MSVQLECMSVIRTATTLLAPTLAAVTLATPSILMDSDVMVCAFKHKHSEMSLLSLRYQRVFGGSYWQHHLPGGMCEHSWLLEVWL